MVEYVLLNGGVALSMLATTVNNAVAGINWTIAAAFAASAVVMWWAMSPRGPDR